MSQAEVNISLVLDFDCPHCDHSQSTTEHDIEPREGTFPVDCAECKETFDLNINEDY